MKIFDVHTHVYPDRIAARTLEVLREKSSFIPAYTNGTEADLKAKAKAAGYTAMLNCPVVTNLRQMTSVNEWCAKLNAWPHLSLGGLFPEAENLAAETEKLQKMGLLGLKFHPEYQGFYILEDRMKPVWEYCAANDFPVLFHAGSDIGFPGGRHSKPSDFAELARRYPGLTIICGHLGGWRNWDEVETELAGAPVYLDTSFARKWMDEPEQFERIICRHGADRVLFGTDSPWTKLESGIEEILSLSLSEADKQRIFWDNSAKIFHLNKYMPSQP